MRTCHFAVMLPLLFLGAQSSGAQDLPITTLSSEQEASHTYALQSFRERRYSAAYGRLAQLADAGHVPSAQLALVMYRNGPTLFDSVWFAAPSQLRRWNALVIDSASSGGDFAEIERAE